MPGRTPIILGPEIQTRMARRRHLSPHGSKAGIGLGFVTTSCGRWRFGSAASRSPGCILFRSDTFGDPERVSPGRGQLFD
jgi:hypothetical protein